MDWKEYLDIATYFRVHVWLLNELALDDGGARRNMLLDNPELISLHL